MIRVIVVDDEQLIRRGFSLIIDSEPDLLVVGACTGTDAVDVAREQQPDVALVDVRMPDVDGLTILQQLRALANPPAVAMQTTFSADDCRCSATIRRSAKSARHCVTSRRPR